MKSTGISTYAHPGARVGELRYRAAAVEKSTIRELRTLRAPLATHDYRRCDYLIKWKKAHMWHPEDPATD